MIFSASLANLLRNYKLTMTKLATAKMRETTVVQIRNGVT